LSPISSPGDHQALIFHRIAPTAFDRNQYAQLRDIMMMATPVVTMQAARNIRGPKGSFIIHAPITAAIITLVSRNADTMPMGARVPDCLISHGPAHASTAYQ
jgi:hypothetical protein